MGQTGLEGQEERKGDARGVFGKAMEPSALHLMPRPQCDNGIGPHPSWGIGLDAFQSSEGPLFIRFVVFFSFSPTPVLLRRKSLKEKRQRHW